MAEWRWIGLEEVRLSPHRPRGRGEPAVSPALVEAWQAGEVPEPLVVRPVADGYELLRGEAVWRAAQRARVDRVPAWVEAVSEPTAAAVVLLDHPQGRRWHPLAEAEALEALRAEGLSDRQIAALLGWSRTRVCRVRQLLRHPEPVRRLLAEGRLTERHARVLRGWPPERQVRWAERAARLGWSAARLEREMRVRSGVRPPPAAAGRKATAGPQPAPADAAAAAVGDPLAEHPDPNLRALEREVSEALGHPVRISWEDGRGWVRVQVLGLDALEAVLERLRGGQKEGPSMGP